LRQFSGALPQRIRRGPAFGLFLVSGSALFAEAAGYTGIDWAVIDMEAAAMTKVDALHQAQALTAAGVPAIIRVPNLDRHHIEHALDLGVQGVMVPKVECAEDARLAGRFTRYPPDGTRGVNAIRAGAFYRDTPGYLASANENVLCIVQIESREAVRNAAKIADADGVDLLFIGTNDLTMDLGQPGDTSAPAFDEARGEVLAACAAAGKPAGIFAHSVKLAQRYAAEGFNFVAVGNEIKSFVQSTTLTMSMLRK
jgi:2-keto-3-deoxy-L-rhamnonate aldolase RhmA